jgi:hypothetical protein
MNKLLFLMAIAALLTACGGDDGDTCTPQCEGKVCGTDGCGDGLCGECGAGQVCLAGGCLNCDLEEMCKGRQCGPSGCGQDCGACGDGQVCNPQSQLCIDTPDPCEPVCQTLGFECGPDGCGGDCGSCPEETFCKPGYYLCEGQCLPDCAAGTECGPDNCGGECGQCAEGEICDAGACLAGNMLPDEDYRILFGYQGRIPGVNDSEHDLFIVKPDRQNPINHDEIGPQALTTFALDSASDCQLILAEDEEGKPTEYGPCSCNFGCVVDRSLQWIAVSVKKPTATGFTFQLGRFDDQLHVAMVKGIFMKEIVDFKFAGNYLYYTRSSYCDGAHCQYQFSRVQLEPIGQTEDLFVFPPENDPDWPNHSNYKGHFHVSQDGTTLVILGTTIRSNRIYMWKAGNLHELDYICNNIVNDDCIGAGSEYTDTDPVAISPDNSKIAAFTIAEKDLRLRVYDTNTLQQKYLNLFSVASGTYFADVCKQLNSATWEFQNVTGTPRFSADGTSLYFISNTECNQSAPNSKAHTNLLMMDIDSVGDGTPFEQSDIVNITNNPRVNAPENIVIDAFDLSPGGKSIIFTGTPQYKLVADPADPKFDPLPEDSSRAYKDSEIWLIGANGAGRTQLTDDNKFSAKSPLGLDASVTLFYNTP